RCGQPLRSVGGLLIRGRRRVHVVTPHLEVVDRLQPLVEGPALVAAQLHVAPRPIERPLGAERDDLRPRLAVLLFLLADHGRQERDVLDVPSCRREADADAHALIPTQLVSAYQLRTPPPATRQSRVMGRSADPVRMKFDSGLLDTIARRSTNRQIWSPSNRSSTAENSLMSSGAGGSYFHTPDAGDVMVPPPNEVVTVSRFHSRRLNVACASSSVTR